MFSSKSQTGYVDKMTWTTTAGLSDINNSCDTAFGREASLNADTSGCSGYIQCQA